MSIRKIGAMVAGFVLIGVSLVQSEALPARFTLDSQTLSVVLHTMDGSLSVRDLRTGQTWVQRPLSQPVAVTAVNVEQGMTATLRHAATGLDIAADLKLEPNAPGLVVTLSENGALTQPLAFPQPFASAPGMTLLLPLNEGIGYPVDDPSIQPRFLTFDRSVQQTTFSNGTTVTVNFGENSFHLPDGAEVAAMGFLAKGM